ncbi:Glyoxylase, beta-lactamase superfamily II [Halogranum rubrum]|uniref:Glyoxylase, beta-lactamase superfamily II n=1 Tax=Halogranum rubrum TaxID=553466 RepID=A0A1I4IBI2_9EURY|nr:MBL fold metallo-hydrolase [Halogranum rubrum]SFL51645.1 Glyoxylase, beta-lactamase superfamily II [Halogranum rubrum]
MAGEPTRITLDVGNPEGANSAYVLPESGVVVDPGPPTDEAWERLCSGVEAAGLGVEHVAFVFVTHWHADHAGLAPRLAEAADATVVMHETDAPLVADYGRERERRVERDAQRLREWGVPSAVVEALQSGDRPSPIPDSLAVETVKDGESLAGLTAIHTPGHTLGHAAFVTDRETAETRDLFVGDLVLPTYTPNVGGGDTRLDDALATYLASLGRIREVAAAEGVETVAPGHGAPLALGERVDEIVAHHDERSRRTVAALATCLEENEADTATPWDVARTLFGELSGIHAKMGAGEAASHLDFLRKRGAVEQVGGSGGSATRYRVADAERAGVEAAKWRG